MNIEPFEYALDNILESLRSLSNRIEITVHNVHIDNLDNNLNGLTIAQISDLHINKWNIELIEHTIDTLNRLNADIVTITGDIICNGQSFIPDLVNMFKKINAKYGVYSCLGNHDHSDGDNSLRIQNAYKKCDVNLLVNESDKININGSELFIAGADDIELGEQNISSMVKNISDVSRSIFLVHNPINFKYLSKFNPDLILAGHTHGGQFEIATFKFFYKLIANTKYISGKYSLSKSMLYVNRGIGTAILAPKVFGKKITIKTPRINSKPEISVFKLLTSN